MRTKRASSCIRFNYLAPARISASVVKDAIALIFKRHGKTPENVNYVFCTDEYLLKINQTYLKHDFYTDIVTFDLSESPGRVIADVFISVDRVRENAGLFGVPLYKELIRVVLHGALHLVGYSDKGRKDKDVMRRAEERYLNLVLTNVPRETKAKKKFHVEHRKRVS
jgi:probable rRNA maturation factor